MWDFRQTKFLRGSWTVEGCLMARYYFHIKDGADLIQDAEGSELATAEDARSQREVVPPVELAVEPGREPAA